MHQSQIKYIIAILAVVLFTLVITADFHHNHPATVSGSTDCAVYLFQTAVSSGLVFLFLIVLLVEIKSEIRHQFYILLILRFLPYSKLSNRAPPLT
jgi:hypothetical protein